MGHRFQEEYDLSKKKSARARKEAAAKQAAAGAVPVAGQPPEAVPAAVEKPLPPPTVKQPVITAPAARSRLTRDQGAVILFSVLLLFTVTVQTAWMAMALIALALVFGIGRQPLRRMRERFCIAVIGLLIYEVITGFSAIYSHFGDTALAEFYKQVAVFALVAILLARFEKKHVRGLLWGFAAVCAVIGFLCVDAASNASVFGVFRKVTEAMEANYSTIEVTLYSRVNGIYNDANVSGSILALGSLISLYLALSEGERKRRILACFLLGISAQSFFLSLSRGAILCFGITLVVWLAVAGRGRRLRLFTLMFISAVVTMMLSLPAMRGIGTRSLLPDLLTLLTGILIFLLDWTFGERAAHLLEGRGKILAMAAGVLAVLCVVFLVAAVNLTQAHTFQGGSEEALLRALRLEAGGYTLSAKGSGLGNVSVQIYSQTDEQALIAKERVTELYNGSLAEAAFVSPGKDANVFFSFSSAAAAELQGVTLSNGAAIPMDYKLLPSFLVNRLQGGIFSDTSYLQRVQFMVDAWKIFVMSPVIGHGISSTENLYPAVQPFFYQSRFVHNHLLQVMCDTGLIGLVGFLGLLGGVLWLLVHRLREERDPLAAVLLACWVMINSHSLMEINFSVRAYFAMAMVILLLPVLLYARPVAEKAANLGGLVLCALFWVYLAVFGGLLESRRMVIRDAQRFGSTDAVEYMSALESYARRDVFYPTEYQLEYLVNAVNFDHELFNDQMLEYVKALRANGSFYACSGITRYYYLPGKDFKELFACSREGTAQRAADPESWNIEVAFYRTDVLPAAEGRMDDFIDGVLKYQEYLLEFNQGRIEEIVLAEENQAFMDAVAYVRESGMSDADAFAYLSDLQTADQ